MTSLFPRAVATPYGFAEIQPADLATATGPFRLVDVREPHEFTGELGHLPNAELVPLNGVLQAAAGWAREAPLVLVCKSGGRSGKAAGALAQMGFKQLVNLSGGMLAVNAAKLPVQR